MTEYQPKEKKTDWRDGKHPLSVRVKTPEKVAFMEALIHEQGNSQAALDCCIVTTMQHRGQIVPVASLEVAPQKNDSLKRMSAELAALKKEKEKLVAESLKNQKLISSLEQAGQKERDFEPAVREALEAIKKKKGFASDDQALRYCITYVLKNDWL